ncbi:MAG TPA: class I SAM-dependent methyltransferase, partial [Solirubrobacterales bacterium]
MTDLFSDAGGYERATGRFSRQFGRQFVPWMAVRRDARWLDAGCGTGALTHAIIDLSWAGEVVGVDTSDAYLEHARRTVPGARFDRASILELPFDAGHFDAVVCGLVLHHLGDPAAAVREMARVTATGGQVGIYVWDRRERQNAAYGRAIKATGAPVTDHLRGLNRLGTADELADLLNGAGLTSTQSTRLEASVDHASFDEWWEALMGRQGPH